MKTMRLQKLLRTTTVLFLTVSLSACGSINFPGGSERTDNQFAAGEEGSLVDAPKEELPQIDEFDPGMSTAHFISAPSFEGNVAGSGITDYDISYEMTVDGTDACFVLGDSKGEFGDLILCNISDSGIANEETGRPSAFFSLKHFFLI